MRLAVLTTQLQHHVSARQTHGLPRRQHAVDTDDTRPGTADREIDAATDGGFMGLGQESFGQFDFKGFALQTNVNRRFIVLGLHGGIIENKKLPTDQC